MIRARGESGFSMSLHPDSRSRLSKTELGPSGVRVILHGPWYDIGVFYFRQSITPWLIVDGFDSKLAEERPVGGSLKLVDDYKRCGI